MRFFIRSIMLLTLLSTTAAAYEFKLALLHGNKDVFSYEISVLQLALANAEGQHTLEVVPMGDTNQSRIIAMLEKNIGPYNIFFSGFSKQREDQLLQVDFPLSRGLLGHRIFIIHKDNQQKMTAVTSLDEMRRTISIGSGLGWPDSAIFKHNGFNVKESSYLNLWNMLEAKRFVAFNRGVNEAFVEIEQQQARKSFIVDKSLMVTYPYDYFFYLSPQTPELRDVVLQGLENAFSNGAFVENFNSHPQIKVMLRELQPQQRTIFHLENPLLSDRINKIPKEYWLQLE